MHHLAPLAPDHSAVLTTRRSAILDGITSDPAGDGLPAVLESLRGVAIAGLCLLAWLGCSGASDPATVPSAEERPSAGEASPAGVPTDEVPPAEAAAPSEEPAPYIVQGTDLATVVEAVRKVGGELTHELAVIRAVGARLTESQRQALEATSGITRIWEDRPVSLQTTRSSPERDAAGGLKLRE